MARRVLHDEYFRRAKAEGFLARSAYKLLELNEKKRLMKRGDRVLDLGCAPGSWLQVCRRLVGAKGVVVGIDLQEVEHAFEPNVHVIRGDLTEFAPGDLLGESGRRFDCVVSDMAPPTTGHGDHFRSVRLCEAILDRLPVLLREGGNLAMKVFEGEAHPELVRLTGTMFDEARSFKPRASRDVSRETYVVGKGYRGGAA
ncbi:MAG: RlmE family RNA methyltransferase [Phycisphaerales bacterium JB059]